MLDELRKEGQETRRGGFTLDREKAREKMSSFSLADPRRYVLELVQAAVLMQGEAVRRQVAAAGAEGGWLAVDAAPIRFDIDSDDLHLRFGGEPFTVEDFDLIYASLFSGGDDRRSRARRQLALGLNAALALNPRYVRVVSGDADGSAVLEMRPGKPDFYEAREEPVEGTHVHVKSRFRPGLVVQFFRNVAGTLPEERLLEQRCKHSWYPVDLEGRLLAQGLDLPDAPGHAAIPGDGDLLGLVGFVPGSESPGTLHLFKDGVFVTSHQRARLPRGSVAAVDAEFLRKDVSQANIVQDAAYLELVERVRRAAWTPLAALGRKLITAGEGDESYPHRSWLWGRLLEAMREQPDPLTDPAPYPDSLKHVLLRVPFWVSIDGRWWSVEQLQTACAGAEVGWTEKTYAQHVGWLNQFFEPDTPVVLYLPDEADVAVLTRLFGERLTWQTDALDRVLKREENRRLWRSRRAAPRLVDWQDTQSYLATKLILVGDVRCEVGLAADRTAWLELNCVVDGHVLCKRSLAGDAPGVTAGVVAVVEGGLTPDEMYDDVRSDDGLGRAVEAVLLGLRGAFDECARSWFEARRKVPKKNRMDAHRVREMYLPREDEIRARLLDYLALVNADDFPEGLFVACGVEHHTLSEPLLQEPWRWRPVLTQGAGNLVAGDETPPYDQLPLFGTVGGDWLSLVALRHWMQEQGELRWVRSESERDPECGASILWLTDPARRVLEAVFGAERLREDEVGFRLALQEAMHLRKRAEPIELADHTAGLFLAHFRVGEGAGSMEGELALWNRMLEPLGSWEVRLLRQQRPLGTRRKGLSLPTGMAVVNSDVLQPTELWDDVLDGAALADVWGVLRRVAMQLLVHLATNLDRMPEHSRENARELIRKAVCAWFPPVLASTFAALRGRLENDEEAVALYEELLRPLGSVDPGTLALLLDAGLTHPDELPDPALIFVQLPGDAWPLKSAEAPLELDFTRCDRRWEIPAVPGAPPRVVPGDTRSLRRLLEVPILETSDGTFASPWELLARSHAGEPIHYVHRYSSDPEETMERVVVVSGPELDLVLNLVGEEGVVHGGVLLEKVARRKRFLAREVVDRLVLAGDETLVRLALDEDGIQGEVGLAAVPEDRSWIDLHQERRLICRSVAFTKPGLAATVNDERLTVNRDYTGVERDDRLRQVYTLCESRRESLYLSLAEQWEAVALPARRAHVPWLLEHFAERVGESYATGATLDDAALGRLAELQLLEGANGSWHSLEEVRRGVAQFGHVDYLQSAREGELLDPSRVVLLAGRQITSQLTRIFGALRDYAPQWDDDQVLLALRRHGAPALPAADPEAGLVRTQFGLSPWDGMIYLPEDPTTELLIRFGLRGTEVMCWQPSLVFPCAGRFDTDKVRLYRRNQRGALTDAQERILERQACSLYQTLASRFRSRALPEAARIAARVYLRHAVNRLHLLIRADRDEQLNRYWRTFYRGLEGQPLFPLANGEWVSLQGALELRPPELAGCGLWEPSDEPPPTVLIIGRTQVVPHELEPDRPAETVRAEESLPDFEPLPDVDETDEEPWAADDITTPSGESVVAMQDLLQVDERSAEERLVEGLRAELEAQHTEENRLLDDLRLRPIRLSREGSVRAVSCDESGILLHRSHPVVGALLDDPEAEPVLLSMLAMGVYTAVNLHLEEVTDDHEAQFQHLLLQRVRTRIFEETD